MKAWGGREEYGPRDSHGPRSLRYINAPDAAAGAEALAQVEALERYFGLIEYWSWDGAEFVFVAAKPKRAFCCGRMRCVFVGRDEPSCILCAEAARAGVEKNA